MNREEDARRMRAALALARRGLGETWPNPSVGCLILRDGALLARGRTAAGGRPHAERAALAALAAAGGDAKGATVYVTLEPCAHHGRTPPCAEALVAAAPARVVAALGDPDPRVAGRGFAILRAAGIAVTEGVEAEAAARLNAGFLTRLREGRPFLTLKLAASLDGRIALASGESRWITGPEARRRVHLMRAEHDAILVGLATLRADDPALDVRIEGLEGRSPLRLLLDSRLEAPPESRLVATAQKRPLWILHGPEAPPERAEALRAAGAELIAVPMAPEGGLNLRAVFAELGTRGLTRVFCEGGGRLAAGLIGADLVDSLAWFSAGAALGSESRPAMGPLGLERLAQAPRWRLESLEPCGADLLGFWARA
ncbi:bifunctional diaminohydroxyphosphoribosylaminopyrimidine deaminase/5-amino-6-(5-phosphoribosylamino)uracil reductase RibD [Neomegalonema sp.]|uniref:bifunctional diaminohydroxyphosphoribosylaminopyrimidine deaminase/5-amino-6-(5-phosphoribosylamino)uracil reductase RibD n=1 Tax=Neomegalonema sp. TaxID=2039713 RepID=UPI00262E3E00|nr:bifunctional diaminohydroxyphosphoribosylaminopyrimidine deaminase/5-amino-6-(5-phosphoribosylamino)uracil reductase RibD [Neomegalonema sp.]MDD2867552.1 bifunctional diaminohydroxyphosphoribosylaminopyrimidine deaminase/5-amino-6-(5-phosphoribosylamino)uracil reductase RibD [Neomegalonema sp.]